jgi:hypothetical protein
MQDAFYTQNWADKLRIWFMPTGWRPTDVQAKYPDFKIEDPYNFQKYNPAASLNLKIWTWCQFLFTYFLLYYLFNTIAKIGMPAMFYYGGFLFLTVFAYSELMDQNPNAIYYEAAKNMIGIGIIVITKDWFGMSQTPFGWAIYVILAYFVVATLVVAWFSKNEVAAVKLGTA